MKKILFLTLALACSVSLVHAADVFGEGNWLLNGTVGKGAMVYKQVEYDGSVPLLSISGEYCVVDDIFSAGGAVGVGAYFGYASYNIQNSGIWLDDFIVGARGTFHFQFVDRLDTYAGCVLGIRMPYLRYDSKSKDMKKEDSRFAGGGFLGASYFFFENLGINAEVGYGVAYANIGIVLRWGN